MNTKDLLLNQFRQVDAFEYVDAYRLAVSKTQSEIDALIANLDNRITSLEKQGKPIPPYFLAAYRGYEDAKTFNHNPHYFSQFDTMAGNPCVVTLNQSDEFTDATKTLYPSSPA
jgi:hypothetical protein